MPSTLSWTSPDGARRTLTQTGNYPIEGKIAMRFTTSRASAMAVRLRIPAWSSNTERPIIRVNGQRISAPVRHGFSTLRRVWRDGDRIDLELSLPMRLEPIDSLHPETVALMRGPLVLFAIAAPPSAPLQRHQLLSAAQAPGHPEWRISTPLRIHRIPSVH